jgi:hypothetical protein
MKESEVTDRESGDHMWDHSRTEQAPNTRLDRSDESLKPGRRLTNSSGIMFRTQQQLWRTIPNRNNDFITPKQPPLSERSVP